MSVKWPFLAVKWDSDSGSQPGVGSPPSVSYFSAKMDDCQGIYSPKGAALDGRTRPAVVFWCGWGVALCPRSGFGVSPISNFFSFVKEV